MESVAKISLIVFGILMILGGVSGYMKAKSKPSLIAGAVSGALMIASYIIAGQTASTGIMTGLVVSILLIVVFAMRLSKTKKFMPSGMLLILSVIEAALLGFATVTKG